MTTFYAIDRSPDVVSGRGHPAMKARVAQLEAALIEIAEIAEASDGPVAKFYGMLARRALEGEKETHQ